MEYMLLPLLNSDDTQSLLFAVLSRIFMISFSALGIVFVVARYFSIELPKGAKRKIAFFSMLVFSFMILLWFDYIRLWYEEGIYLFNVIEYLIASCTYLLLSCIFYAVVCFRFYDIVSILIFDRILKINKDEGEVPDMEEVEEKSTSSKDEKKAEKKSEEKCETKKEDTSDKKTTSSTQCASTDKTKSVRAGGIDAITKTSPRGGSPIKPFSPTKRPIGFKRK